MELMVHVRRPVIDKVKLQILGGRIPPIEGGTVCITAFHLIFSMRQTAKDELTILHTAISHLDYKVGSNVVIIYFKDFRRIHFEFATAEDCKDLVDALEILSRPENLDQLFAFSFSLREALPPSNWSSSPANKLLSLWKCSENRFRVSTANKGFKICSSYPEEVIVPASITDEDIIKVANFRHAHRFPIVSFHHQRTLAVLVKCGQPLCGHTHKKLKEDVSMLNAYLPSRIRGKIIDIRPHSVASSHMSKGGGMESPAHYPQWKVEHAKFETPSVLQASLNKLLEACYDSSLSTSSSWFGRVEASGWLGHVSKLLEYARKIALAIHSDGSSVVIHGASSRDATLQLTSLTQVLLDHQCRTTSGFIELIEREWLNGGHQFSLRHHPVTSAPDKEKAPVFLLFLDTVWQVMQQFPLSFQFNERFLHLLFLHSYSSQYGNFLYDTPKERVTHKLKERTHSLWDYLQSRAEKKMVNPLYERNPGVLLITVTALNVGLWRRLYLRTDAEEELELPGYEALRLLKEENKSRKERLAEVKRELEALQVQGRKYASNWS